MTPLLDPIPWLGEIRLPGTVAAAVSSGLLALSLLTWPIRPRAWPPGFGDTPGDRFGGARGKVAPRTRRWRWRSGRRREEARFEGDLTGVLDSLGQALRAGLPVSACVASALRSAPPDAVCHPLLRDLYDQAATGEPLAAVWQRHAAETGSHQLTLVARAWSLSERTGAPLAGAIASTGRLLRDELAARRRVDAATAQARMTVRMLSVMPLTGPLLGWAVGVDPVALVSSSYNYWSVGAGWLLFVIGRTWVKRQVKTALSPRGPG